MLKDPAPKQHALEMVTLEELVPQDHLLRHIARHIDFRGLSRVQAQSLLAAACQNMKKMARLLAAFLRLYSVQVRGRSAVARYLVCVRPLLIHSHVGVSCWLNGLSRVGLMDW